MRPIEDVTQKPTPPKVKRRGRKVKRPFRMVWPKVYIPPDVDLMKLENWGGWYCGCGQRKIDGALCLKCLHLDWPTE